MFEWTQKMQIDNGKIDADHQKLIEIANRIFTFSYPNRQAEDIKEVIRELYDYVKVHFAREEAFMTRLKYPGLEAHQKKHAEIISDMNHHLTTAHHMGEVLSHFRVLINRWIIDHIMQEDLKIHRYMEEKLENKSQD